MPDGIKLAVDVYLPSTWHPGQRMPTILHQTRYWRAMAYRWPLSAFKESLPRGLMGHYAKRFLANGYAWMSVDVRGSGASFGHRRYSHAPEEISDGGHIVDWILQQPWSNGQVGSLGISYSGASAELLLVNQHPAVKAVAPMFSGFDLYPEIAFPGGIHLTWFTNTWQQITDSLDQNTLPFGGWLANLSIIGVHPVDEDPNETMLSKAIASHRLNWKPHKEALGITFRDDTPPSNHDLPNIDALGPMWYQDTIDRSGAAVYSFTGWFDGGYQHAAIRRHLTLTNPQNKLIIGPWDHGGRRQISPYSLGPAQFDHVGELLKFFDYHLKSLHTGIDQEAPIHYFTMGEEQWKATNMWPPMTTPLTLHLAPQYELQKESATEEQAKDIYSVDTTAGTGPESRWHTLVGLPINNPYPDRSEQDEKLLVYTSTPLIEDIEITGHPSTTLHLSTSSTDATIFVYLEDVSDEGKVSYVTEGMLRGLHRQFNGARAPYRDPIPYRSYRRADGAPMIPGEVATLSFNLLPTSYLFKKGNRIRLAIAGVDKDHFLILPGPPPTLSIYRSHQYPSQLILPHVSHKK
ncbi:CocE/NonD family hydrolase [Candidatus Nitronereus thalassa]|uniref:CocE/NonD family hydrolase n=1 Tax=Candidatus Nitronereus thalassa TaxID=3020898 RepID=A0ABU3K3D6_9BACT|nr:CocE/NonD family hydrolase [Candidatus Nitronereus thalassa]MDT7040889.1 CocE/NonD family hydrolase [Candidatus Nitronereus thalassa]